MTHVTTKRVINIAISDETVKFIIEENVRDDKTKELIEHENVRTVLDVTDKRVAAAIETLQAVAETFTV
jgi:hypothetical protein